MLFTLIFIDSINK